MRPSDGTKSDRLFFVSSRLFALAVLWIGLAVLAFLPPFEGVDETGHYSMIRQSASGSFPVYGQSKIDALIDAYRAKAPLSYSVLKPYRPDGVMTYDRFAARGDLIAAFQNDYKNAPASPFAAGRDLNWQAQHPPLYYFVMACVAKASASLPFVTQFFVLRAVSFLLAFAGLIVGAAWAPRAAEGSLSGVLPKKNADLFVLAAPFVFPIFFPEFARVGNDSLCLLLLACALWFFEAVWRDPKNQKASFAFGLFLGLGLLTKAFFLPVTFGFALLIALRAFRNPTERASLADVESLASFPVVLGGFWYLYKFEAFGSLTGGADFIAFAAQGDWKLLFTSFPFLELLRGIGGFLMTTTVWTTGSLGFLPLILAVGPVLLNMFLIASFVRRAPCSLPVWIVAPVLLGFAFHLWLSVAMKGSGETPGWYLAIFMPFWGAALATQARHYPRIVLLSIGAGGILMLLGALTSLFLYDGCFVPFDTKVISFGEMARCSSLLGQGMAALRALSFPEIGLGALLLGISTLTCGLFALIRAFVVEKSV